MLALPCDLKNMNLQSSTEKDRNGVARRTELRSWANFQDCSDEVIISSLECDSETWSERSKLLGLSGLVAPSWHPPFQPPPGVTKFCDGTDAGWICTKGRHRNHSKNRRLWLSVTSVSQTGLCWPRSTSHGKYHSTPGPNGIYYSLFSQIETCTRLLKRLPNIQTPHSKC